MLRNSPKKTTPVFTKPTVVSSSTLTNSDFYALIVQMKDHMQQHVKTNGRILREIDKISRGSLPFDVVVAEFRHSGHNFLRTLQLHMSNTRVDQQEYVLDHRQCLRLKDPLSSLQDPHFSIRDSSPV